MVCTHSLPLTHPSEASQAHGDAVPSLRLIPVLERHTGLPKVVVWPR